MIEFDIFVFKRTFSLKIGNFEFWTESTDFNCNPILHFFRRCQIQVAFFIQPREISFRTTPFSSDHFSWAPSQRIFGWRWRRRWLQWWSSLSRLTPDSKNKTAIKKKERCNFLVGTNKRNLKSIPFSMKYFVIIIMSCPSAKISLFYTKKKREKYISLNLECKLNMW